MKKMYDHKLTDEKPKKDALLVLTGLRVGFSNKEAQDWEISDGRKYGQNP